MSKFAFIFPGQGSQAVGMLDGFTDNLIVRDTVAEASEVLGVDLGKLISEGPKEVLDLTTNTQPLMLTCAVAFYRAWIGAGGKPPDVVAGHSLGEYSALVAAGVMTLKDALPLVRFRAQVMQEAVPLGVGTMAVIIGLGQEDVRALCLEAAQGEVLEAVNFNAPTQIVIAGHTAAIERGCGLALAKGAAKAMLLPVSAPFHSSLLKPASDRLAEYLVPLAFSVPQIATVNNADVATLTDPIAIKDALVRQAASPVRWVETIQKFAQDGISQVVECGPGKVLTGLTKRIDRNLTGVFITDQVSLDKLLGSLQ